MTTTSTVESKPLPETRPCPAWAAPNPHTSIARQTQEATVDLSPFRRALRKSEAFLLGRLFILASKGDYARYMGTREEVWRMAIRKPRRMLERYLEGHSEPEAIHVDESLEETPRAVFGIVAAQRHRARGVDIGMFLGLMKLVREAFVDLVHETPMTEGERRLSAAITHRLFDKIELGACSAWLGQEEGQLLQEMETAGRRATRENGQAQGRPWGSWVA